MPKASDWRRVKDFPKEVHQIAEETHPGKSFGPFMVRGGIAAKKTEDGVIKICDPHSKKWVPITL